jgi:hypothetical protein
MNALTKPDPATMPMAFSDMERFADAIAKSGLFGMKTREQALVLMLISHAEGRHPALAARDYDVIQGRPSKKAEAMLRDFLQAGGKVEWHTLSDSEAEATFTHPQGGSARIGWNTARAVTAQLAGKDNWKKFPRQMLRSRVISEGVRTVYPLATSGLYVPEEVADLPPHNGPTLEHDTPPATTRDAINREIPLADEAPPRPKGRTAREFIDDVKARLLEAPGLMEVNTIIAEPNVQRALMSFKNGALNELQSVVAMGIGRFGEPVEQDWDDEAARDEAPAEENRQVTSAIQRMQRDTRRALEDVNKLAAHQTWLRSLPQSEYDRYARALEARYAELARQAETV